ncbi:hypothetical protein HOH87_01370 [bacterium]|nr:hypothetical protein [bacterium]
MTLLTSCNRHKDKIQSGWMDSTFTQDVSLGDSKYRLSTRYPNPTEKQKNTPVILTVHGFTASTYEWSEFQNQWDKDFNRSGRSMCQMGS